EMPAVLDEDVLDRHAVAFEAARPGRDDQRVDVGVVRDPTDVGRVQRAAKASHDRRVRSKLAGGAAGTEHGGEGALVWGGGGGAGPDKIRPATLLDHPAADDPAHRVAHDVDAVGSGAAQQRVDAMAKGGAQRGDVVGHGVVIDGRVAVD